MIETNVEKLANILQLMFFIVDALKEGVEIEGDIISKAERSLPKIQQLLKEIEEEHYSCNSKAVSFGQFLLSKYDLDGSLTEKMFKKWNEKN